MCMPIYIKLTGSGRDVLATAVEGIGVLGTSAVAEIFASKRRKSFDFRVALGCATSFTAFLLGAALKAVSTLKYRLYLSGFGWKAMTAQSRANNEWAVALQVTTARRWSALLLQRKSTRYSLSVSRWFTLIVSLSRYRYSLSAGELFGQDTYRSSQRSITSLLLFHDDLTTASLRDPSLNLASAFCVFNVSRNCHSAVQWQWLHFSSGRFQAIAHLLAYDRCTCSNNRYTYDLSAIWNILVISMAHNLEHFDSNIFERRSFLDTRFQVFKFERQLFDYLFV